MIPPADSIRAADQLGSIVELAVSSKIHLDAITQTIAESKLARELERGSASSLVTKSAPELFEEIFPSIPMQNTRIPSASYGDAYWCGWVYMQLYFEYRKPLPYLFLAMPLKTMLDLYPVYHEMDVSQLFERYEQERDADTITIRLMRNAHMSATRLSRLSGVPVDTIRYYRKSDENAYRAGFQNIFRISQALNIPPSVFMREVLP